MSKYFLSLTPDNINITNLLCADVEKETKSIQFSSQTQIQNNKFKKNNLKNEMGFYPFSIFLLNYLFNT